MHDFIKQLDEIQDAADDLERLALGMAETEAFVHLSCEQVTALSRLLAALDLEEASVAIVAAHAIGDRAGAVHDWTTNPFLRAVGGPLDDYKHSDALAQAEVCLSSDAWASGHWSISRAFVEQVELWRESAITATSEQLEAYRSAACVVFAGARVLNRHLG